MLATEYLLLYSVIVDQDHQQLKAEEFFYPSNHVQGYLLISALELMQNPHSAKLHLNDNELILYGLNAQPDFSLQQVQAQYH